MTQLHWSAATGGFTPVQASYLKQLRDRFAVDHDLFDERELARLRFQRWLYQTGRLQP